MLKRRLLKFAAVATMVVPTAVATALAATSASATTAVPASSHWTAASTAGHAATASQARGAALVVRSDLAAGCVNITNAQGLAIAGHGVNAPVRLEASGNCFTKVFPFTSGTHTGYEYQNGDGHCLFNNGGTLDVGAACKDGHPNEEFFGTSLNSIGWLVENVTSGAGYYMDAPSCALNGHVQMVNSDSPDLCPYWNFPAG